MAYGCIAPQSSRLARPGASAAAQLGKILVPIFLGVAAGRIVALGAAPFRLQLAQLDAADLAGDGLGQLGELQTADALERRQVLPDMGEDRQRGVAGRRVPGGERDEG